MRSCIRSLPTLSLSPPPLCAHQVDDLDRLLLLQRMGMKDA